MVRGSLTLGVKPPPDKPDRPPPLPPVDDGIERPNIIEIKPKLPPHPEPPAPKAA